MFKESLISGCHNLAEPSSSAASAMEEAAVPVPEEPPPPPMEQSGDVESSGVESLTEANEEAPGGDVVSSTTEMYNGRNCLPSINHQSVDTGNSPFAN